MSKFFCNAAAIEFLIMHELLNFWPHANNCFHGSSLFGRLIMAEGQGVADSLVTEFATYNDFLDSQITPRDLYYLEVAER